MTFSQTNRTPEYLVFCFKKRLQVVCGFAEQKGNALTRTRLYIGLQTLGTEMISNRVGIHEGTN